MLHPLSRFNLIKKLPVFFLLHIISITSQAQVFNTSVSAATGGTGRAAVQGGDALYLNPASMVHLRGHQFYTSYNKDEFMVSISDNTPESVIPGALGYIDRKSTALGQDVKTQGFSLALAQFVVERLTFGVTAHHFTHRLSVAGDYQQNNADLGMMFTVTRSLGLGLSVYNVFGERSDVPEELRFKTSAAAGFNYIYKEFIRFRLDATSKSIYMGGIESYVTKWTIFRAGYSNDTDKNRELWTVGAGFDGPKFALNYAYQGNSKVSGDYRHSVDLQIPF